MSQQRHAYLAVLLERLGARHLADLGCGDAAFLHHLLQTVQRLPALKTSAFVQLQGWSLSAGVPLQL